MITIKNLNKYFFRNKRNEVHVINDVSLEFPQKGLVTICGESGSGKTTLLNVIGGLDGFHSGNITIDDNTIKKYNARKIDRLRNEKIGYIFQNFLLLPQKTIYENLDIVLSMYDLSLEEKNDRINYVLKAVDMLKFKNKLASELSTGQQQRIAIARALIKSPSLILADEPTGNLDEKNTIQIMNIIKKISKNVLVILVSHEKDIALSYSDYIINLSDGKVINQELISDNKSYKYEDDQNIYLKEYKYTKVCNDQINIDFYNNTNNNINLQIVFENNKFYIKSNQKIVLLDENSNVSLIDDYKKELDVNKNLNDFEYELNSLDYVRSPRLSFKKLFELAMTNLKKFKKRTSLIKIPLFFISILSLLSVQSLISGSKIDKQHIAFNHSNVYNVIFEKGNAKINVDASEFAFMKFYEGFQEEHPNIEPVVNCSIDFVYNLSGYKQIKERKYELAEFSTLSDKLLKQEQLLYGRLPQNASEIVIDKWVLENTLEDSTLSNFMDVKSFLNQTISIKNEYKNFKIVGISETNENVIYLNDMVLINELPSNLKKAGFSVCTYSEYLKFNSDLSKNYNLKDNEALVTTRCPNPGELILNGDYQLGVKIIDKVPSGSCPFDIIISDSLYSKLLKSVLSSRFEKLDLYCENEDEVNQVKEYVEKVYDFYSDGSLKPTEEFGFPPTSITEVSEIIVFISSKSIYEEDINDYVVEMNKTVSSRLIIVGVILIFSILTVFFSMKSFTIANINDIGIYRALGINKGSIILIYFIQILILSLKVSLLGTSLCYLITNAISVILVTYNTIAISLETYLMVTLGLISINVLIGIVPIMICLRRTPYQILSKSDI